MGKSTISTGRFSIATLNYQRVKWHGHNLEKCRFILEVNKSPNHDYDDYAIWKVTETFAKYPSFPTALLLNHSCSRWIKIVALGRALEFWSSGWVNDLTAKTPQHHTIIISHYHAEEKHMHLPCLQPIILSSVMPSSSDSWIRGRGNHSLNTIWWSANLQCSLELMVICCGNGLKKLPSIPSNWGFCTSNLRHKSRGYQTLPMETNSSWNSSLNLLVNNNHHHRSTSILVHHNHTLLPHLRLKKYERCPNPSVVFSLKGIPTMHYPLVN